MTVPDLGSERPGDPSDTRQLVERGRTETGAEVSGRAFLIAFAVIAAVIVGLILVMK